MLKLKFICIGKSFSECCPWQHHLKVTEILVIARIENLSLSNQINLLSSRVSVLNMKILCGRNTSASK